MQFQVLLRTTVIIAIILGVKVTGECGEELQRCAVITEEYEHLIQEIKRSAFRNCFIKQTCNYELLLFENCFERSIRAMRAPFNRETPSSDNFGDSAHRYLSAVENCFEISQEQMQFPDLTSALIDEDAIYARTIYSTEYADQLWGLPQLVPTHPYLGDSITMACLMKEKAGRVFGNGINRYIDSADPKLNNLNNSCILEEHEMQCYRRRLSNDRFYQELLIDRDRIVRSCIRSVRLQTQCRAVDSSRLRACICSAREEFENRIQASILQCVRRSHMDQLNREHQQPKHQRRQQPHEHLNKLTQNIGEVPSPTPFRPSVSQLPTIPESPVTIMQGTVLNGHCLCACPYNNHINYINPTIPKYRMHDDFIIDHETTNNKATIYPNIRWKTYQDYYNDYLLNLEARRMMNGS